MNDRQILYPVTIKQGETFLLPIQYNDVNGNPMDLTNFTAKLAMQDSLSSSTTILSLTSVASGSGQIILGGTAGTIVWRIEATCTMNLPLVKMVYDLFIYDASVPVNATWILGGPVKIIGGLL